MITSLSHNVQLYFGKYIEAKLSSRRLELALAYSLFPLSLLAFETGLEILIAFEPHK